MPKQTQYEPNFNANYAKTNPIEPNFNANYAKTNPILSAIAFAKADKPNFCTIGSVY